MNWLLSYNEETLGGHQSRQAGLPVNARGQPIPWITYPAIEFLIEHDFSNAAVFEYGSGNSSRFWSSRCLSITSVESDSTWYTFGAASLAPNQSLLLRATPFEYAMAIHEGEQRYDIIVIDGEYRYDCAVQALQRLAGGGMIILDNSDWHANTCILLRKSGLVQVDFKGTGPLNSYASCTSMFLHGHFSVPRVGGGQDPLRVSGGLVHQSQSDSSYLR